MNKQIATNLSSSLQTFLEPFEEQHNIKVNVGNGKFDSTTLSLKLELVEISENGEDQSIAAKEFKSLAAFYGLNSTDLNREFSDGVRKYKIVGLKPRSIRYPIIAESLGKRYKFAAATVKVYLASCT